MFATLIERNRQHFSQAEGTPFILGYLKELIRPFGTSQFCTNILTGKADISNKQFQEATQRLLKKFGKIKGYT